MSTASEWSKPRHHAGTDSGDSKNFVGYGTTVPKTEGGNMRNLLASKKGKRLARRAKRRG